MATIQVRIDDDLKSKADTLFKELGTDTTSAIRMFLTQAIAYEGIPFEIKKLNNLSNMIFNLYADYFTRTHIGAQFLNDVMPSESTTIPVFTSVLAPFFAGERTATIWRSTFIITR
mgnify:CR=1 FL=1